VTTLGAGGWTVLVVEPRIQQHVAVLVPQRHAQAVVAVATLPQLAGDDDAGSLAALELRVAEYLVPDRRKDSTSDRAPRRRVR
jgi:hypothetical protein